MKLSTGTISARVLKAISVFSGVQVVGILCSVIRSKCIALWIGEAGVGLFAIFNSVIDLMSTATQLNLRDSTVRDISAASNAHTPRIAGTVRWWAVRLGLVGGILMLLLSPLLSMISFGDLSYWWAFALLAISVFATAFVNSEWAIMQGTKQLGHLAHATITGATVGTIVSLPLYYWLGIRSIIPSLLVFSAATVGSALYYRNVPSGKNTTAENISKGMGFIRLGAYLTVSTVVSTLASYVFLSYLNRTTSTSEVGLYQAGYTLVIRYTGIILTALVMEYFPRLSQVAHRKGMASTIVSHEILLVLYLLTPLLVIFVMADALGVLLLYTSDFLAMLPFVTVGIGAMIFRAVSYCMAYVIISRADGRAYILTEILSSAIGLTLNITMFSAYGFIGLGISYVLWYLIYMVMVGCVYRYRYGMRLSADTIVLIVISTLTVASAILLKHIGIWYTLAPLCVSLAMAYYGYIRIFKNKHKSLKAKV